MQSDNTLFHIEEIRVNFFDADPLGIVWHGNYIKYFEIAREAFGRKYGLSYLDVKKEGYATPIVKTETEHKLSLQYGDMAKVEVKFINSHACKLLFEYQIYSEAKKLICTGKTTQVFTEMETGELALINPDFFEQWKLRNGLALD